MFFKCVLDCVLGYSEYLHSSFLRHSDGQLLFLFLTWTVIM